MEEGETSAFVLCYDIDAFVAQHGEEANITASV